MMASTETRSGKSLIMFESKDKILETAVDLLLTATTSPLHSLRWCEITHLDAHTTPGILKIAPELRKVLGETMAAHHGERAGTLGATRASEKGRGTNVNAAHRGIPGVAMIASRSEERERGRTETETRLEIETAGMRESGGTLHETALRGGLHHHGAVQHLDRSRKHPARSRLKTRPNPTLIRLDCSLLRLRLSNTGTGRRRC